MGTIVAFLPGLARMKDPWHELVNYSRDLTNAGLKHRMILRSSISARQLQEDRASRSRNR